MLTAYILPDLATVPDGFDLAAELAARGFPAREIGTYCGVRERDYITPSWDFEEDGGDALVWNPDTEYVWYLSRGDVEAARKATPGTPFVHLRYSYYILTEDMNKDLDMLRREGLDCQICASHLDGTDMEPTIYVMDVYGDTNNPVYPGEMIVYAHGALYDGISEEVREAVKATA